MGTGSSPARDGGRPVPSLSHRFPTFKIMRTLPSSAEGVGLVPGWGAVEEAWASWSHLAVMQFVIQFEFVVSQRHFTFPSVISIICKAGI